MKKIILRIIIGVISLYIMICSLLFFFQEKLIFFPEKLPFNYKFNFDQPFEELKIKTDDDKWLSGVLFKANNSKGLVFYLHGNAGSLRSWGEVAVNYTNQNYDLFMLDYRGYGKSQSEIKSQEQLFNDLQNAYNMLKQQYAENNIIVLGYSIGTGPAAKLASANNPKLLVLQAPYYSLTDMMKHSYPTVLPSFILKYKFETNRYLKDCRVSVVIFHGDADEVIYYGSSLKLTKEFKSGDTLITLKGWGHNNMTDNKEYQKGMNWILNH